MQVSVEATSGLERRMTVEVPDERIEKEVQSRLQQLARTTRIKGFRPGKVPVKVVADRYGEQVRQKVIGEVMQSSFKEAITQQDLHPVGAPKIEPESLDKGQNLRYVAIFEVMPEVEPASLSGVKIEKASAEVTDEDVDRMIETLRKQNPIWEEVDRPAEEGDRVVIDFHGTIEGEEFSGNKGENVPVTLGSKRMVAGFEEGLIGAKAGDELKLDLSFPEDYGYEEVSGKPVQFAVTVKKVEASRLPEVDDEFAKRFGVAEGGAEALRKEVRENMERELEQSLKAKVKQQVMDKLVELASFDVPQALVQSESEALMNQMRQNMYAPQGKSGVNLDPSMFEEQAKRRVTLGLILSEIIKRNDIKASPEKVRGTVESFAASYERPEEVINWYYGDKRRLAEVESLVLEDQVVEWALEQADVEEVQKAFDDIMGRKQEA